TPDGVDADAADAEQLYRLLEEEVVPLFYDRDARDVPLGWVDKMKHALRVAGRHFTAQRMVRQYVTEYYVPRSRVSSRETIRPPREQARCLEGSRLRPPE